MSKVELHDAESHPVEFISRVRAGETIVLCDQNVPVAEIHPVAKTARTNSRPYGLFKGQIQFPRDWFDLDKEIEETFEHSEIFPGKRISKDENPD